MERTHAERRVYDGGKVKRGYKVTSITVCQEEPNSIPRETVPVRDKEEYSSGCKVHPRCLGHMCITPEGNLLPFHSLSLASGEIVTQYLKASAKAFAGSPVEYRKALETTNKGKHGHLRSIMKTPVSGSARLVVTPHDGADRECIYISDHLASKITFCDVPLDENGVRSSTFVERRLREGDMVILERPPSLTIWNNQPLRVVYWNRETLGVHTEIFSQLGGDYDGDEAHVFPLGTPEAVREAKEWKHAPFEKFDQARVIFSEAMSEGRVARHFRSNMEFLEYTTLSAAQIMSGGYRLTIGDLTRNKNSFIDMLGDRMRNSESHHSFVEDAIQGVKDVMRQQLGQGSIGHLTRIAKIAMMCFVRSKDGGTSVVTSKGLRPLLKGTLPSRGVPSVRVTLALCGVAQQSRLNAHKVGEMSSSSFDLVSSIFLGRMADGDARQSESTPTDTLYMFPPSIEESAIRAMRPTWMYRRRDIYIVLAKDDYKGEIVRDCIGAYSPVVLHNMSIAFEDRVEVCLRALRFVFSYNGVGVEGDDLTDMAAGLSYQVGSSVFPITCSEGLRSRDLGWTEKAMGTDMRELGKIAGMEEGPHSSTSAAFMSNFSLL